MKYFWVAICVNLFFSGFCLGQNIVKDKAEDDILTRDSLTDGLFGLNGALKPTGISTELTLTNVYQQNVHGGLSTHRRSGRYSGSFDLGLEFDMEKILGISGADFYMEAQGSWSDGPTDPAVGSLFPVNSDAAGFGESFLASGCEYFHTPAAMLQFTCLMFFPESDHGVGQKQNEYDNKVRPMPSYRRKDRGTTRGAPAEYCCSDPTGKFRVKGIYRAARGSVSAGSRRRPGNSGISGPSGAWPRRCRLARRDGPDNNGSCR